MAITDNQKTEIKEVITDYIWSGKTNTKNYIPVLLKIENDLFSKQEPVFIEEIETLVRGMVPQKDVFWIVGGIEENKVWMGLSVMDQQNATGKEQFIIHDLPYNFLITIK